MFFPSLGKMSQTQQVPSGYIWVAYGTAQRTDDEASSYGNPSDYAYTTTSSMPQGSNLFKVLADLQMVRPRVLAHLRQQTILGLLDTVLVNVSLS